VAARGTPLLVVVAVGFEIPVGSCGRLWLDCLSVGVVDELDEDMASVSEVWSELKGFLNEKPRRLR